MTSDELTVSTADSVTLSTALLRSMRERVDYLEDRHHQMVECLKSAVSILNTVIRSAEKEKRDE